MRHVLMFAMILGLTFGFAPVGHAKDEISPDPEETLEGGGGKGGGEEEECDPKVDACDEDEGGGEGVSGSWHGYKAGSKELEQEKARLKAIRDSASDEAKAWIQQNKDAREAEVAKDGGGGK